MKKHKNILCSLGSYIIAFLWLYLGVNVVNMVDYSSSAGGILNIFVALIYFILIIAGIVFAYKSKNSKESSWAGNLSMVIGILIGIYFLLMYMGLMGV